MDAQQELYRVKEVLDRVRLSKTTLYAQINSGDFPAPVKIGRRAVAWRKSEVDTWINAIQSRPISTTDKATTKKAVQLDLSKPVQTLDGELSGIMVGKKSDGRLIFESADGFIYVRSEDEVENIPEPKVATALMAVYKKDTGKIYISTGYEGSHLPRAKITYTEGAESPWQIEQIKEAKDATV